MNTTRQLPWWLEGHHPESVAVVDGALSVTYGELARLVAGCCDALRESDMNGKCVAWEAQVEVDTIVLLLALLEAGATACPLNSRASAAMRNAQLNCLGEHCFLSELEVAESASHDGVLGDRDTSSGSLVVFTSGSTGEPKGVLHSASQYVQAAKDSNKVLPLVADDRWLLNLPLYHVGGLGIVFRCLLAGATVVLARASRTVADVSMAQEVTHLSIVPTHLYRLLEESARPPEGLRVVLVGGAPLGKALAARGLDQGWPLATTYGCTEFCSQIATSLPGDPLQAMRLLPGRDVKIAANGEIQVQSEVAACGYLAGGELHRLTDADGWYTTDDLGSVENGVLQIVGRLDNQFISGGENIQPEHIEAAIGGISGVRRVCVVPVDDPEWGQRPAAFVESTTHLVSVAELRDQLSEVLPGYMMPVAVWKFPAGSQRGLKVSRAELAELAKVLI